MLFFNSLFFIINKIFKNKSYRIKCFLKYKGYFILSIIGLIIIYSFINSFIIETTYVEVESEKIDEDLKIVSIADLHLGPIYGINYLDKIFDKIDLINPDIVIVSGDFVDGSGVYNFNLINSFKNKTYPIYLTFGNHEIYAGDEYLNEIFNDVNINILRNEKIYYKNIQIIGIDDSEDTNQVYTNLKNISIDELNYSILLYHRPNGFIDAKNDKIDLMFSGHTHRGQIFPFSLFVKLAFPYIYGLYEYDGSYLYVTSGIATWGPKLRFLSNNEIVVIDVLAK
ncbi:MAG: metallophosphoesterase [Candidatus Woesearchaeota archaeon]